VTLGNHQRDSCHPSLWVPSWRAGR